MWTELLRCLKKAWLLPVFVLLGVDGGDGGAGDGGQGGAGDGGAGDGGQGGAGDGGDGGQGGNEDLSTLFTADEVAAKKEAIAAAKAEEERRAALSDAEREAEDAEKAAKLAEEEKGKAGAPEKYEQFTMPEGMTVDKQVLDLFEPFAKKLNLSQERAQSVVDFYSKEVLPVFMARQHDAVNDEMASWVSEGKADKDIGGDKYDQNVEKANRFLNTLGTPRLKEFLEKSGTGNYVEFIRVFSRAADLMDEDSLVLGGAGGKGEVEARISNFYGNSKMN